MFFRLLRILGILPAANIVLVRCREGFVLAVVGLVASADLIGLTFALMLAI